MVPQGWQEPVTLGYLVRFMRADQLERVEESYARCTESPGFLDTFYQHLLESSPAIPPMFSQTDFERQTKLLQHSLGVLIIYAKRQNPALLERIAERHNRDNVNVKPDLYPFFVESLVEAVAKHDPQFDSDAAEAWRAAVTPGIEFMKARY